MTEEGPMVTTLMWWEEGGAGAGTITVGWWVGAGGGRSWGRTVAREVRADNAAAMSASQASAVAVAAGPRAWLGGLGCGLPAGPWKRARGRRGSRGGGPGASFCPAA